MLYICIDEFQTHMHLLSFQDIWATVHSLHVCTLAVKMALTLNFYGDSENIDLPCYKTLLRSIQLPNFNYLILHCLIFQRCG